MERLTHDEVRKACGASSGAKEMTCPCCGHRHLQLFGDDGIKCQNGCTTEEVTAECRRRLGTGELPVQIKPPNESGSPTGKLTLADYGIAKHLSAQLLEEWFGAREGKHPYYDKLERAVCFPYFNERGEEITQQWRWGMGGKDRRFLKDKPTYLYAGRFLALLEQMAESGNARRDIFIVEGESNTHTLAQNSFPVLGLPGVGNWQPKWANLKCLQAAKRLYVFLDMESDGKPQAVAILGARRIAESFEPGKVLAVKLPMKDISELWLFHMTEVFGEEGPEGFRRDLQDALLAAKPIIPEREEVEGLPPDLGEQVLNACPILRDFVKLTLPVVETDINNLVCDFLACAGAAIGLRAYAMHHYDKHPAATFHLLIADTTVGKGTAFNCVNALFRMAVPDWMKCLRRSMRSQQALYRMLSRVSVKELGVVETDDESKPIPNPEYTEGRLLIRSTEVSAIFKSMRADWSTLSQGLREAYDGGPLSNEVSKDEDCIRVNEPYALALSGDVVPWELSEVIESVDFANGLANRLVWCVAHQTKAIPRATHTPDYTELAARLRRVIPEAPIGEISYSEAGAAAWDTWFCSLPRLTGKLASACARTRANALRLAVLFAVLDENRDTAAIKIEARHVQAAAAILDRHRATVAWFLERPAALPANLPNPEKSKLWRQIEKVRAAQKNGRITGKKLYHLFSNETAAERTAIAEAAGLHAHEERDEKGNKIVVWS